MLVKLWRFLISPGVFSLLSDFSFLATHALHLCSQPGEIMSCAGSLGRYLEFFRCLIWFSSSFQISWIFWSSNFGGNSVVNAMALFFSFPQSTLFQMGTVCRGVLWIWALSTKSARCHHGPMCQVLCWGFSPVRVSWCKRIITWHPFFRFLL